MSVDSPRRPSRTPSATGDPATPILTDGQLIEACLAGDQRAWEVLIHRYQKLICSFPRKYGASSQDVADVFQVVCSELFLGLGRLRQHDSVRAWVCKVAARQSYQWKRRHLIRTLRENAFEIDVAHAATPARQFLDAERAELVSKAMAQLTDRHRLVIESLFFKEPPLPYDVLAKRLGVTPGSVSFLRARGLRNLEKILGQQGSR